jgi:two-component system response regulator
MGFTRDELALLTRLDERDLEEIEHGVRAATLRDLMNLAEVLHVTVGRLLARWEALDEGPRMPGAAAPQSPSRPILMVEDNAEDAELTSRAFEMAGIGNRLVVVRDAEQGLDYLFGKGAYANDRPANPQLILLDLNLPRMPGVDFLRRVKGYPSTLHIPVVVLTATRDDRAVTECGRLGAEGYIVKPLGAESSVIATPHLTARRDQRVLYW